MVFEGSAWVGRGQEQVEAVVGLMSRGRLVDYLPRGADPDPRRGALHPGFPWILAMQTDHPSYRDWLCSGIVIIRPHGHQLRSSRPTTALFNGARGAALLPIGARCHRTRHRKSANKWAALQQRGDQSPHKSVGTCGCSLHASERGQMQRDQYRA